jgi:hypothetical protein
MKHVLASSPARTTQHRKIDLTTRANTDQKATATARKKKGQQQMDLGLEGRERGILSTRAFCGSIGTTQGFLLLM